ncbi:hypothetical protein LCGC14_2114130 [marine sediment metagenome]|uniref:PD-(D/E)XK endonuclease-like domain-containing protein n=1 Tax=marine sediment metagenome TaxID=412755 RepID=A0A0F9GJA1_9ZZZZ
MLTPEFASNSRLSTVKACLRKFYFNYEKKLIKSGKAIPLDFGSCWHTAMDSLWKSICWDKRYERSFVVDKAFSEWKIKWLKLGRPVDIPLEVIKLYKMRTPGVAKEMLYSYFDLYINWLKQIELIAIEQPFAVPLDPNNPTRFYIGFFDKVYKISNRIYIKEHKTTTLYSVDQGVQDRYIKSFEYDSQIDGYSIGLKIKYRDEPELKMGAEIDIALVHLKHHDIFKIKPVNKLDIYDKTWIEDTIFWWDFMDAAKAANKFPRNDSSCQNQYGTCDYLDICMFTPDIKAHNDEYYENFPGYEVSTYESFPYEEVKEAVEKAMEGKGENHDNL